MSGGKHMLAFANLLSVCNAGQAMTSLSSWQQAQNAVATQVAIMTASAISWASKIAGAETDKQKAQLGVEAAAEAAAQAVVLKQLNDAAKIPRDEFVLMLMSSSAGPN